MLKQLTIAIGLSAMVLAPVSYATSAPSGSEVNLAGKRGASVEGAGELQLIGSEQSVGGRSKSAL
jgi:hypothetical protein